MNVMKEIQKKTLDIERLKSDIGVAEDELQALKKRRMGELSLRKCPECGKWLKVPGIISHINPSKGLVDCPQCKARLTAIVDQLGGDPLSEDGYQISLSRSGWSYEDTAPGDLTNEQIQSLIDDLAALPETGRTRVQRERLAALMSEKVRR